jgi:catalase
MFNQGILLTPNNVQRNSGPNYSQLPINRPLAEVHNNYRDGAGQMFIYTNNFPYTPNTLNNGSPHEANKTFFTARDRGVDGRLTTRGSSVTDDHYTQPRLFLNSLPPVEKQFLIDAIRFETSQIKSKKVKENVIAQLNKICHDVALRVAWTLGLETPHEDPTHYHDFWSKGLSAFMKKLPTIKGLVVGILVSERSDKSLRTARELKRRLFNHGVVVKVVSERLVDGADLTYQAADASFFDGVIVADGAEDLFGESSWTSLYPVGWPRHILLDAFRWGKTVGAIGDAKEALEATRVPLIDGVFCDHDLRRFLERFEDGLRRFKWLGRFPTDYSEDADADQAGTRRRKSGKHGETRKTW